jgi:hypothetical protein
MHLHVFYGTWISWWFIETPAKSIVSDNNNNGAASTALLVLLVGTTVVVAAGRLQKMYRIRIVF